MANRSTAQRARLALERLASEADVWVATASLDGAPHLVPLSLFWHDGRILVSTLADTPTARNATATGRARAALQSTADVVVFDVSVDVVPLDGFDDGVLDHFATSAGWDPRAEPGEWVFLVMTLDRGHAWNQVSEMEGRTIVRNGEWMT